MKRDVDLARQLLLDIENRGADCSVSVLRSAPNHEGQELVRYHLLLLIDAGYLREVDRTDQGVPCIRLTDAGHELIELTRSETRWREAKAVCQQLSGGMSIGVIRTILWQWALQPTQYRTRRRFDSLAQDVADPRYRGRRAPYRFDAFLDDAWEYAPEDEVRYVRVRPAVRESWQLSSLDAGAAPAPTPADNGSALPQHLI